MDKEPEVKEVGLFARVGRLLENRDNGQVFLQCFPTGTMFSLFHISPQNAVCCHSLEK